MVEVFFSAAASQICTRPMCVPTAKYWPWMDKGRRDEETSNQFSTRAVRIRLELSWKPSIPNSEDENSPLIRTLVWSHGVRSEVAPTGTASATCQQPHPYTHPIRPWHWSDCVSLIMKVTQLGNLEGQGKRHNNKLYLLQKKNINTQQ